MLVYHYFIYFLLHIHFSLCKCLLLHCLFGLYSVGTPSHVPLLSVCSILCCYGAHHFISKLYVWYGVVFHSLMMHTVFRLIVLMCNRIMTIHTSSYTLLLFRPIIPHHYPLVALVPLTLILFYTPNLCCRGSLALLSVFHSIKVLSVVIYSFLILQFSSLT